MKKSVVSMLLFVLLLPMVLDLGPVHASLASVGIAADRIFGAPALGLQNSPPLRAPESPRHVAHLARPHLPRLFQVRSEGAPLPESRFLVAHAPALAFLPQSPSKSIFHPPALNLRV
jgi:hypothetical protein